jgi:hypothetical protein
MVDLFFRFFFIARANQKIPNLALGRQSSKHKGSRNLEKTQIYHPPAATIQSLELFFFKKKKKFSLQLRAPLIMLHIGSSHYLFPTPQKKKRGSSHATCEAPSENVVTCDEWM